MWTHFTTLIHTLTNLVKSFISFLNFFLSFISFLILVLLVFLMCHLLRDLISILQAKRRWVEGTNPFPNKNTPEGQINPSSFLTKGLKTTEHSRIPLQPWTWLQPLLQPGTSCSPPSRRLAPSFPPVVSINPRC